MNNSKSKVGINNAKIISRRKRKNKFKDGTKNYSNSRKRESNSNILSRKRKNNSKSKQMWKTNHSSQVNEKTPNHF